MSETSTLIAGTFAWVDLATTNPDTAKKFYASVLGWTYQDNPMGDSGVYSMALVDGQEVAGLYGMEPGKTEKGIPPHWSSYVLVASADETARRITEAGGTLLAGPFDVSTHGRMAVALDPTGAPFAIWEAREHKGASLFNAPGALCWNELMTDDPAAAREFYTKVFSWGIEEKPMGETEAYTIFKNRDHMNGGMMKTPEPARQMGVPPNWLVYFAVSDCDATFKTAMAQGGKSLMPPTDFPDVGRGAVMADPTGAAFAIIQLGHM